MAIELEKQMDRLDELLERYLGLVDEYERSRGDLTQNMASVC
jgi:hypothetical protein